MWRYDAVALFSFVFSVRESYNADLVPSQHFVFPLTLLPPQTLQSGGQPYSTKQINGNEMQEKENLMAHKQNKFFKHVRWHKARTTKRDGTKRINKRNKENNISLFHSGNCNSVSQAKQPNSYIHLINMLTMM